MRRGFTGLLGFLGLIRAGEVVFEKLDLKSERMAEEGRKGEKGYLP